MESVTRNAGIAGIIVSEQAGVGYYIIPASAPDIELSFGVLGGYRFDASSGVCTVFGNVRKMLTVNTFAGLRIGAEIDGSKNPISPVISAETGFKF